MPSSYAATWVEGRQGVMVRVRDRMPTAHSTSFRTKEQSTVSAHNTEKRKSPERPLEEGSTFSKSCSPFGLPDTWEQSRVTLWPGYQHQYKKHLP